MNKPFNLAEALAGKPVVNGNGDRVFITVFAKPIKHGVIIMSQDEHGFVQAYHTETGRADSGSGLFQLYMAPTTVTKWVNVYATYDTEGEADRASSVVRVGRKAHLITYEE